MAKYYGVVRGNRGEATRCGSKASGLTTTAASWEGAVEVRLYDKDGESFAVVSLMPWRGSGVSCELWRGPVGHGNKSGNGAGAK